MFLLKHQESIDGPVLSKMAVGCEAIVDEDTGRKFIIGGDVIKGYGLEYWNDSFRINEGINFTRSKIFAVHIPTEDLINFLL